jgi:opacity protein-like surface antigen
MAGSGAVCDSLGRPMRTIFIAIALFALAPAVRAEDMPQFQVGLNGGYRMGGSLEDEETAEDRDLDEAGSFAVSLELRYRKGDDRFYQLWYSHQSSSVDDGTGPVGVDVEYLHVGGTLPFGGWERAQPYFAAGLGGTRFSSSAPGADDITRFSGSMAFGLEVQLAKNAAIRLEARGYATFVDTNTSFFCKSDNGDGVCRIVASGSTILQAEALAGILVRF